jgi:hypothetical protein
MPEEDFRREVEGKEISSNVMGRLRERYGVSLSALAIRFNEVLGVAVSSWRRYQRHPGERVTFRVEASWGSGVWLPKGLTTRYLQPDLITPAAARGHSSGTGVLAFGGKSRKVSAIAIALEAGRNASHRAAFLDEVQPAAQAASDQRVILFLRELGEMTPGEGREQPQQLALLV